eukprot:scaffold12453_cov106-Isochrysis_galbana.AAC.4
MYFGLRSAPIGNIAGAGTGAGEGGTAAGGCVLGAGGGEGGLGSLPRPGVGIDEANASHNSAPGFLQDSGGVTGAFMMEGVAASLCSILWPGQPPFVGAAASTGDTSSKPGGCTWQLARSLLAGLEGSGSASNSAGAE